jgi:hypothetical protein
MVEKSRLRKWQKFRSGLVEDWIPAFAGMTDGDWVGDGGVEGCSLPLTPR